MICSGLSFCLPVIEDLVARSVQVYMFLSYDTPPPLLSPEIEYGLFARLPSWIEPAIRWMDFSSSYN